MLAAPRPCGDFQRPKPLANQRHVHRLHSARSHRGTLHLVPHHPLLPASRPARTAVRSEPSAMLKPALRAQSLTHAPSRPPTPTRSVRTPATTASVGIPPCGTLQFLRLPVKWKRGRHPPALDASARTRQPTPLRNCWREVPPPLLRHVPGPTRVALVPKRPAMPLHSRRPELTLPSKMRAPSLRQLAFATRPPMLRALLPRCASRHPRTPANQRPQLRPPRPSATLHARTEARLRKTSP
mmetsp:Transcript_17585/g.49974  ORF Transcript_17585/g.49974 Transcript_17585/m.49974 type:complete len:240 (+) Transcript_17585:1076-1795(+)